MRTRCSPRAAISSLKRTLFLKVIEAREFLTDHAPQMMRRRIPLRAIQIRQEIPVFAQKNSLADGYILGVFALVLCNDSGGDLDW